MAAFCATPLSRQRIGRHFAVRYARPALSSPASARRHRVPTLRHRRQRYGSRPAQVAARSRVGSDLDWRPATLAASLGGRDRLQVTRSGRPPARVTGISRACRSAELEGALEGCGFPGNRSFGHQRARHRTQQGLLSVPRFYRHRQTFNHGEAQANLDGVPSPQVEVTALSLDASTPHLELLCYRSVQRLPRRTLASNDVAATRIMLAADELRNDVDAG